MKIVENNKSENIIKIKSYEFALRIVELYRMLVKNNEYVLSKQLLKSGTSIGANVEIEDQYLKPLIAESSEIIRMPASIVKTTSLNNSKFKIKNS